MLIALLESGNTHVADLCANALGNLAANGPDDQARMHAQGAVQPLVQLLAHREAPVVRSAAFALSQLFRGSSQETLATPTPMVASAAAMTLCQIVGDATSGVGRGVTAELLWLLSELVVDDGAWTCANSMLEFGLLHTLVEVLRCEAGPSSTHHDPMLLCPALRIIGTFAAVGSCDVMDVLCDMDVLTTLQRLIMSRVVSVRSEAVWVIVNIANSDVDVHAQALLSNGVVPHLVALLGNEVEVRKEAMRALLGIGHRNSEMAAAIVKVCCLLSRFTNACLYQLTLQLLIALYSMIACMWVVSDLVRMYSYRVCLFLEMMSRPCQADVLPNGVPLLSSADLDVQLLSLQLVDVVCRLVMEGADGVEAAGGVARLQALQLSTAPHVQVCR